MKKPMTIRRFVAMLTLCASALMPSFVRAETDENGITPNTWIKFDEQTVGTISASTKFTNSGSNSSTLEVSDGSIVANGGSGKAWTMGSKSYQPGLTKDASVNTTTYILHVNFNGQTFSSEKVIFAVNGKNYQGPALSVSGGGSSDYTVRLCKHSGGGKNAEVLSCTVSKEVGYHWFALTTSGQAMNTSVFYVDGSVAGTISKTDAWYNNQNNFYVFGKWGGNGGDAVPTGIIYDDIRSYEQVLTEDQIKKITNIGGVTAVWGNAGSATEKGVATKVNGGSYTTFKVNFGESDNISQTGIEGFGSVCISKIRLFRRSKNTADPPATITISQDGVADVVSTSVSLTANQKVYGSSWPETASDFYTTDAFDAVFDSTTEFNTSKPLTISFAASQLFMIQPSNSVMQVSGWSPAIEITGVYTEKPDPRTFTATLDGTKKWSELTWSPALPQRIYSSDTLQINASGTNPTLLMDEAYSSSAKIAFSGDVTVGADESLYEDGCWQKDILAGTSITVTSGTISTPGLKSGFVGAYTVGSTAISLRAQNKEVISVNFAGGYSVSGTGYTGLAPVQGDTWMNMTTTWSGSEKTVDLGTIKATVDGASTKVVTDATGSCRAANTYSWNGATDVFLKGYLDDGGNHAQVAVTNIPYSAYDVIVYCATDTADRRFRAVTVNGTAYTYDSANPDTAKKGSDSWGASRNMTAVYGTNAIRIRNQTTSTLTIVGGSNGDGARGGIAAVQIVCTGEIVESRDFTAKISDSTNFGDIKWNEGAFVEGVHNTATITVEGDEDLGEVVITFEKPSVVLERVSVISSRPVRLVSSDVVENVQSADLSKCSGKITLGTGCVKFAPSSMPAGGLRLEGTTAIDAIPYLSEGFDSAYLELACPVNAKSTDNIDFIGNKRIIFDSGFDIACNFFRIGNYGNTSQYFEQRGGTIKLNNAGNATSTTTSPFLLGHWAGADRKYDFKNGTINAQNGVVRLGWDGACALSIGGGENTSAMLQTKGIRGGVDGYAVDGSSLTINVGGMVYLGENGIYLGATNFPVTIAGGKISTYNTKATVTVAAGIKLTADSKVAADAGKMLVFASPITGEAVLTVGSETETGMVQFMSSTPNQISVVGGTAVFSDRTMAPTVSGGKVGYFVTVNDLGKFTVPGDFDLNEIRLFNTAGGEVTIISRDPETRVITFDMGLYGSSCLMEYLFKGDLKSTGSDTGAMAFDGTHCFTGYEYVTNAAGEKVGGIKVASAPWRNVVFPSEVSVVMYGKMVSSNNTCQIGIGSTTQGSKYSLFLASGDVGKKEVKLCYAYNNTGGDGKGVAEEGVICEMEVPNAQTADHLYAFTMQQVSRGNETDTQVNIYLDGEMLQPCTFSNKVVTLGSGIQLGSIHGGVGNSQEWPDEFGFKRSTAIEENATIAFLRVYNIKLDSQVMRKMAEDYPYVSPSDVYARSVSSGGQWVATDAWECTTVTPSFRTDTPADNAKVDITVTGDSALGVNLDSDVSYEMLSVHGDGKVSITNVTSHTMSIKGSVTADADLLLDYKAINTEKASLVITNGSKNVTVTFDMSSINLSEIKVNKSFLLARAVTTGGLARISCAYGYKPSWLKVGLKEDDNNQLWFDVSLTAINATITESTEFSKLEWTFGGEPYVPDWSKDTEAVIVVAPDEVGTITNTFDRSLYAANKAKLTFEGECPLVLAANEDVAVTNFTYDFSEYIGNVTFDFNPFNGNQDAKTTVIGGPKVTIRYAVDIGTQNAENAMSVLKDSAGVWECVSATLVGAKQQGGRMVRVPEGDSIVLAGASSTLSLDVCGGDVHFNPYTSSGTTAIKYGDTTTTFLMSSGSVFADIESTALSSAGGMRIGADGKMKSFIISNGVFDVKDSFIDVPSQTKIEVYGGKIKTKGVQASLKPGEFVVTNCTLEIGSWGWVGTYTKDKTKYSTVGLTVNGGVSLRAVDDEATMNGNVKGSGDLTIAQGMVKLGNDSGLGTLPLTVVDGATLDLNGCKALNKLNVSGMGVGGVGAIINNSKSTEGRYYGTLTFTGDTTIGGSGVVSLLQGSDITLGGNTLTIAGNVMLGGFTVKGENGRVMVAEDAKLLSNGATALGVEGKTIDLTVSTGGTLDLSGGKSISCRNFVCYGTIVGNADLTKGATLMVRGEFDATGSVTVPKLTLYDTSVLKGTELTVTSALALGENVLSNVVDDAAMNIQIATIPKGQDVSPFSKKVVVNGNVLGEYTLRQLKEDGELWVSKGGSFARVTLDGVSPWVNLEELLVAGKVSIVSCETAGETNVNVVVVGDDGTSVTQKFAYAGGDFAYCPTNLVPGVEYTVYVYVTVGEVCLVSSKQKVTVLANNIDWFNENSTTFTDDVKADRWKRDNGAAEVKEGEKTIDIADGKLEYHPSDTSMAVWNSRIRDVTVKAAYTVGFVIGAGDADNVGVRMGTNSVGACQLEVKLDGAWQAVEAAGFAAKSNTMYTIMMRMDSATKKVVYTLIADGENVSLGSGSFGPISDASKFKVTFEGTGKVGTLVGVCHDVNLCSYGTAEYANLDEAVEAVGTNSSIRPIWLSVYKLKDESGTFKVASNDLLTVSWDKWYHVVQSGDYNGVTYNWIAGNNWIEYSDENGVEKIGDEYVVNSAEGLAWIAAEATNGWFAGNVTLGADIDLSSKNWTPIAKFTGVFDGAGHIITGLNNTNVVESEILGEAGYYHGGVTNDWGYSSYGLFGCTTNAVIKNVALRDIAISAVDESTAALVGVHAGGDLTICNVTNESGCVEGTGVVAGIVTVGGEGGDIGKVAVNGNVNHAELIGVEGAELNGVEGADVAQILAGTTEDTKFMGEVDATGNVGTGIANVDAPICNFADVIDYQDDDYNYWRYVEANEKGSVPIDPVYHTARMLRGYYVGGDTDPLGGWMDMITAAKKGSVLQITKSDVDIDGWSTVLIDRDVTIDLNANAIYCVYDCNVFEIASGVTLTITNGTISAAKGYQAFAGEGKVVNQGDSVKIIQLTEDFAGRTISPVNSLQLTGSSVKIVIPFASSACLYSVLRKDSLSDDEWTEGERVQGEDKELELEVDAKSSSGFFQVRVITSGIED